MTPVAEPDAKPLAGRTVLVTGATGFLGRHLVPELAAQGAQIFPVARSLGFDLTDRGEAFRAFLESKADTAVHLAARVGGIGANMKSPDLFFRDNMRMGMNMVEAAASAGTRLVFVGTLCSYPKNAALPIREEDFWEGFPEPTNAAYGIAKRSLLAMLQAYRASRGLRYAYLVLSNLYGPGDNFSPESSHVIPALIRRFDEAVAGGIDRVVCWGTGQATRSFLWVKDAAQAIGTAAEGLEHEGPVNLAGGEEISIADLSAAIAEFVGYRGAIFWDRSKPDGQPRRKISGDLASSLLGWRPTMPLAQGLAETVAWYRSATGSPAPAERPLEPV